MCFGLPLRQVPNLNLKQLFVQKLRERGSAVILRHVVGYLLKRFFLQILVKIDCLPTLCNNLFLILLIFVFPGTPCYNIATAESVCVERPRSVQVSRVLLVA